MGWSHDEGASGMASPENILLHLSEDDEQQVRDIFKRLEERGFPAQRVDQVELLRLRAAFRQDARSVHLHGVCYFIVILRFLQRSC